MAALAVVGEALVVVVEMIEAGEVARCFRRYSGSGNGPWYVVTISSLEQCEVGLAVFVATGST